MKYHISRHLHVLGYSRILNPNLLKDELPTYIRIRSKAFIKSFSLLVYLFACFSVAIQSYAAEYVYDNGGTTYYYGYEISATQIADDFRFSSTCLVTGAKFWTMEGDGIRPFAQPFDGHIDYGIYPNIGGKPGPGALTSGTAQIISRTPTGLINEWWGSMNGYEYTINLQQPVQVQANTSYFLALHMLDEYPSPNGEFYWATTDSSINGYTACVQVPGHPWNTITMGYIYDMAFQVNAVDVPEPSILTLFGIGAFGLLAYAWRRRK